MGGRESPRLVTPMVESFSADLLPAIKSHWRVGYKIVAYATSVGVGRQNRQKLCYYCNYQYYSVYCCGDGVSKSSSERAQ